MRSVIFAGILFLVAQVGQAHAACSGTQLSKANLDLFAGKTLCGVPGANYPGDPNDRWQEEHLGGAGGGDLWDYKRGTSTSDPRRKVGTWSTSQGGMGVGDDTITYVYTSGGTYTYKVWLISGTIGGAGSSYSFCDNTAERAKGKLKAGTNVGCGAGDFP